MEDLTREARDYAEPAPQASASTCTLSRSMPLTDTGWPEPSPFSTGLICDGVAVVAPTFPEVRAAIDRLQDRGVPVVTLVSDHP
jgi:hypothetical protein